MTILDAFDSKDITFTVTGIRHGLAPYVVQKTNYHDTCSVMDEFMATTFRDVGNEENGSFTAIFDVHQASRVDQVAVNFFTEDIGLELIIRAINPDVRRLPIGYQEPGGQGPLRQIPYWFSGNANLVQSIPAPDWNHILFKVLDDDKTVLLEGVVLEKTANGVPNDWDNMLRERMVNWQGAYGATEIQYKRSGGAWKVF